MLKIKRYRLTLPLYDPDGNKLGNVNQTGFIDFRIQVAKNKVEGYYVVFKNKKYYILLNGTLSDPLPDDNPHSKTVKLVRILTKLMWVEK